jgi:hypothetical protein
METLREFADRNRVRINDRKHEPKHRLETSEDTIHGRYGEIVTDPSHGAFAVKFIAVPRQVIMTGALNRRYREAIAGGLSLKAKYGDAESTFHFNPANDNEAKLALKLVGPKRRRTVILTLDQKAALVERLTAGKNRSNTLVLV